MSSPSSLPQRVTPPAPSPRGRLIEIAPGRRLHLIAEGPSGSGRPTVLLEAGAFGFSADWAAVQEGLARAGVRSLAYDRSGLGFSDPGPRPRDSHAIISDLEQLLGAAAEPGPYILCGHSMAGLHLRVFAARNLASIRGVVLVDASTPEAMDAAATRHGVASFAFFARLAAMGASFGLIRPFGPPLGDSIGLPPAAKAEKRWAFADPGHNRWAALEVAAWPADAAAGVAAGPYPSAWPAAVVLTARSRAASARHASQSAPARASRSGFVVHVAGANHATLLGETFGGRIVEAVLEVEAAAAKA